MILLVHYLHDHSVIALNLPLEKVYLVFDLLGLDPDLPVLVVEHPPPYTGHDLKLSPPGLQVFRLLLINAGVIGFSNRRLNKCDSVAPTDSLGETQVILVKELQDVLINGVLDDFDGLCIAGLLFFL